MYCTYSTEYILEATTILGVRDTLFQDSYAHIPRVTAEQTFLQCGVIECWPYMEGYMTPPPTTSRPGWVPTYYYRLCCTRTNAVGLISSDHSDELSVTHFAINKFIHTPASPRLMDGATESSLRCRSLQ